MNNANSLWAQCRWPDLASPYAEALREAVCFILHHVEDVQGIIVSGTILRGNPAPSSDLDIYVIRQKPQRQRIQKFFNGVPAEIFINPAEKVREYFEQEHKAARPITAHMLTTGFTILSLSPVLDDVRQQAQDFLARQPTPGAQELTAMRYMVAARYEDAIDVATECPETTNMILDLAVYSMLQYRFRQANRHVPRDKDLLLALETLDPDLACLAREFYNAPALSTRLTLAEQIADRTIETHGFFEWETAPEDVV